MKNPIYILILGSIVLLSACNQDLKDNFATLTKEHAALVDSLSTLKNSNQQLVLDYGRLLEQSSLMEGVFFEVQIGAFEHLDLSQYNEDFVRLINAKEEGLNKYVLGRFISYQDAGSFKKDIKALGIKDAFIVAYIDGERVEINEGLIAAKELYGIN